MLYFSEYSWLFFCKGGKSCDLLLGLGQKFFFWQSEQHFPAQTFNFLFSLSKEAIASCRLAAYLTSKSVMPLICYTGQFLNMGETKINYFYLDCFYEWIDFFIEGNDFSCVYRYRLFLHHSFQLSLSTQQSL